MALASMAGATVSMAARTASGTCTGRGSSRSLPLIARDTSSRSSMRRVCARAFRSTAPSARVALLLRQRLGRKHPHPAEDRGQRRAQLVRQRHQELVFQPAGRFGVAPRPLLPFERRLELLVGAAQPRRLVVLQPPQLVLGLGARRHLPEEDEHDGGERHRQGAERDQRRAQLRVPLRENVGTAQRDADDGRRRRAERLIRADVGLAICSERSDDDAGRMVTRRLHHAGRRLPTVRCWRRSPASGRSPCRPDGRPR